MPDEILAPEKPPKEEPPKKEGRATTFARWALGLLSDHPVVKLVGAVMVTAMSLYAFVDGRLQRREEARRGGWADPPSVEMFLRGGATGTCRLVNLGPRQLREVTLSWRVYTVTLDPCFLPTRELGNVRASEHTLEPRQELSTVQEGHELALMCTNAAFLHAPKCELGRNCQIVVECRARYHRDADLQPFESSRYAVVERGCQSLKGVPPFESNVGMQETELLQERAWRCLAARRPASDASFQEMLESERASDPLADGRW
jgi:hypothetical protein